jgi:uncharacterized protein (TIGR03435 family)
MARRPAAWRSTTATSEPAASLWTCWRANFDLTLKFSREPDPNRPDAPSFFTALQEQLGLKLESGRAPLQTLVIDHIERPSDN